MFLRCRFGASDDAGRHRPLVGSTALQLFPTGVRQTSRVQCSGFARGRNHDGSDRRDCDDRRAGVWRGLRPWAPGTTISPRAGERTRCEREAGRSSVRRRQSHCRLDSGFHEEELRAGRLANGVVVEDVEGEGPAQKAGFKAGDVVTDYHGERVRSTRHFIRLVQEAAPDARSQWPSYATGSECHLWSSRGKEGCSVLERIRDNTFRLAPRVMPPAIFKEDLIRPSSTSSLPEPPGSLGSRSMS